MLCMYSICMKIGNVTLKNNLILAPMASVSNIAFRVQCKRYNAGLCYSEMVNANAVARGNKATVRLARTCSKERPVALQLFGTKPETIKKAVAAIEDSCDIIDFNFGCPAPKIIQQGAGSALMKRPAKIKEIIETLVSSTDKPVTAKIRSGIKKHNCLKIAKIIEDAGASALTVHGRTVAQSYSGMAKWSVIKEVKDALNIPVIANGDVVDCKSAELVLKQTNCDGIMIGRAACGNPFIFEQINHYFKTGEILPQKSKVEMFEEYLELWKKFDLRQADLERHTFFYTKGVKGAAQLRKKLQDKFDVELVLGMKEDS